MKYWLNDFNTTSFRITASVVLAIIQVQVLNIGMLMRDWSPTDGQKWVLIGIAGGILTMMGFDVLQFASKRFSDIDFMKAKKGGAPDVQVGTAETVVATAAPPAAVSSPAAAEPKAPERVSSETEEEAVG